jgi:DNA polymerase I
MRRAIFDVETDALYLDATKVHSLVIQDADDPFAPPISCHDHGGTSIEEGLKILAAAEVLIGHNILNFDLPVLEKLRGFRHVGSAIDTHLLSRLLFPDLENEDTRMMKRNADFPSRLKGSHSLEAWGHRLKVLKDDFGKTTDWKEWSPAMQTYCEQDVAVNVELLRLLENKGWTHEALELEQDFQRIISKQEFHGFRFGREAAVKLQEQLTARRLAIRDELQQVFPPTIETMKTPAFWVGRLGDPGTLSLVKFDTKGAAQKAKAKDIKAGPPRTKEHPFNPGSRTQIAERLIEKYGWQPTAFTETGRPEINDEILEVLPWPEAKLVSEYLVIEKRLGALAQGGNAWLQLERNGRVHGGVITIGTVTRRCSHFKPNMAQVPSVKSLYGKECRSLFTSDPGYVMVGADASGLELRCLAHYMARYDGGAYGKVLLEGDIHTVNQKAAGLETRDQAKTWIYSYLYGAGDFLLGINAGVTDEEIKSLKRAEKTRWSRAVQMFSRQGKPFTDLIVALAVKGGLLRSQFERRTPALARLKGAIEQAVSRNGYILSIDRQPLFVRSKHSALNTLLQSTGSIVVKMATVLMHRNLAAEGWEHGKHFAQLAHVHDEVQLQALPDIAEQVGQIAVRSIREAGEHFKFRVPLDGEYRVGANWMMTH